jgi:hypothetical protein
MPNQNNPNDPNNPSAPSDNSVPPVFAPTADLPPLPPDFQSADTPAPAAPVQPTQTASVLTPSGTTSTSQTVTEEKEEDPEPSGSAAPPPELPPVISSGPKKKFGGGRIIATILGVLMLVGGVAGGVILTQQQQLFEQKASYSQSCYDDCRDNDGKGHQVCLCRCGGECYRPDSQTAPPGSSTGSGCSSNSTSQACNNACHSDGTSACKWLDGECKVGAGGCGSTGGGGEEITAGNCGTNQTQANGWFQCGSGSGGSNCNFCLKAAQRTCNQVLAERNCGTGVGGCGAVSGPVNIYYCPGQQDTSLGCQQNNPLPGGVAWNAANHNITGSYCGTVQVDEIGSNPLEFCSRTDTSTCNQTPPPTQPPQITASCTNVKAYNTSWTQLTSAQLSALPRGSTINFCVVGSATGGSFDRARFTINGALQAETTTKRPNTQDYCQSYTIPATGNSFNVQAQIHHATLGWK